MKKTLTYLIIFSQMINVVFAQWQQISSPTGGSVYSLVSNGTNIISGTKSAIYRSTDNGNNWINISRGTLNGKISTIAIKDNNIYAGTDGQGVFLTTNFGSNWSPISNGITSSHITALGFNNSYIFAGTQEPGGVYRSDNMGDSWTAMELGISEYTRVWNVLVENSLIYATTGDGLFFSDDNGDSWSNIGFFSGCIAKDGINLFVSNKYSNSVYMSTNHGSTWEEISDGLACNSVNTIIVNEGDVFAGTDNGIFKLPNGSTEWENVLQNILTHDVFSLTVSNGILLAGTLSGILASDNNGVDWVAKNQGISDFHIGSIIDNTGNTLLIGGYGFGVAKSDDNGQTWDIQNEGISNKRILSLKKSGTYIYAGAFSDEEYNICDNLFVSQDNGTNWSLSNNELPCKKINDIAVYDSYVYVATWGNGIYLSSDNGNTWVQKNIGLSSLYVKSLIFKGSNLFAGTLNGVYKSTDFGNTWIPLTNGINNISAMCLVSNNQNIYVSAEGGDIFMSADDGDSWNKITTNFTYAAGDFASLYIINDNLFAGTWSEPEYCESIFYTPDEGISWLSINDGLPFLSGVYTIKAFDENIFIGTGGQGLWKRPLTEIITNDIVRLINKNDFFILYPNPSNSILFLEFNSRFLDNTVCVYNIFGSKIYANNFSSEIGEIDVSNFNNGVYLIQVESSEGLSSKLFIKN